MALQDLKARTKKFAVRAMILGDALPRNRSADIISRQLIRAATSVGANYRASQRARSPKDFLNKLGIVEEEADECGYWLELIIESNLMKPARVESLLSEANELTAIVVASINTAKSRRKS